MQENTPETQKSSNPSKSLPIWTKSWNTLNSVFARFWKRLKRVFSLFASNAPKAQPIIDSPKDNPSRPASDQSNVMTNEREKASEKEAQGPAPTVPTLTEKLPIDDGLKKIIAAADDKIDEADAFLTSVYGANPQATNVFQSRGRLYGLVTRARMANNLSAESLKELEEVIGIVSRNIEIEKAQETKRKADHVARFEGIPSDTDEDLFANCDEIIPNSSTIPSEGKVIEDNIMMLLKTHQKVIPGAWVTELYHALGRLHNTLSPLSEDYRAINDIDPIMEIELLKSRASFIEGFVKRKYEAQSKALILLDQCRTLGMPTDSRKEVLSMESIISGLEEDVFQSLGSEQLDCLEQDMAVLSQWLQTHQAEPMTQSESSEKKPSPKL